MIFADMICSGDEFAKWKNEMEILVIGSGGREHAAGRFRVASVRNALMHPNAGIAAVAECVEIDAGLDGVMTLVTAKKIDFVVVGPENAHSIGFGRSIKFGRCKMFWSGNGR